jgi:hypothetical protein
MQNYVPAIFVAMVARASFAQDRAALPPSDLDADIAKLKAETASLISGRTALDAPSIG